MCFPALQKAMTFLLEQGCLSALTGSSFMHSTVLCLCNISDSNDEDVTPEPVSGKSSLSGSFKDSKIVSKQCQAADYASCTVLQRERWLKNMHIVICPDVQHTLNGQRYVDTWELCPLTCSSNSLCPSDFRLSSRCWTCSRDFLPFRHKKWGPALRGWGQGSVQVQIQLKHN